MESSEKKKDAAIRKERPSSLLHENASKPYETMLSFLSFCGPYFVHGEVLPVVDPCHVFWFEPMHNINLFAPRMLLLLTTISLRSALPRAGKILNRVNYFLY